MAVGFERGEFRVRVRARVSLAFLSAMLSEFITHWKTKKPDMSYLRLHRSSTSRPNSVDGLRTDLNKRGLWDEGVKGSGLRHHDVGFTV